MRIVLDGMGGDYAPQECVLGALAACRDFGLDVLLVGQRERLEAAMPGPPPPNLTLIDAPTTIDMDEHPVESVRAKPDSSIVMGMKLVQQGEADAFVSAGNTGAVAAAALFELGRIAGIERPALATLYPTPTGFTLLLDMGANADCRPHHLVTFGVMGSIYAQRILGRRQPSVALLSTGEEETKGNLLTQRAHQLLREAGINFAGNVDGKDLPRGRADVVICDGFVGNVAVKVSEAVAESIVAIMRREFTADWRSKLGVLLLRPALSRLRRSLDFQEVGGAWLLGVNGIVIIGHGRSRAKAITSALLRAREAVQQGLVEAIRAGVAEHEQRQRAMEPTVSNSQGG
ncbi:MAG: phosphate acyltransferase PlsX [Chloroflexi bacterium]|nr:phosphate acyltransferase PlsX [Chloroflexota bacterium]